MVRTLNLTANIPATCELHISLPADFPQGPAEIVLVVSPSKDSRRSTLADFRDSEFFGMWRDRSDIGDSVDFAHELRSEGWKRSA
ncbi:MAG: hypothetical protein JOY54_03540 [Acidobacteriaceae bacterium]|nr:hypothetical protein [Acidobacteriaceae bacterium]